MKDIQECNILEELQALGIHAGHYEESFIENILRKRMTETKYGTPQNYLSFLNNNKCEAQVFESLLQNSYSEFFRNPLTFAVLEKIVFPSLIDEKRQQGKELRIWSAACASGQEPYSLAMFVSGGKC